MNARISMLAALATTLAACACHKAAPMENVAPKPAAVTRTVPISSIRLDKTAGRQVESIRWNRDGTWMPVEVASTVSNVTHALVSRDRMGDRLLVASPSAGYQIARVRLDCARGGVFIDGARRVASDSDKVSDNKDDRSLMPMLKRDQVQKVCTATAGAKTYTGAPFKVVADLREIAGSGGKLVEPSAEQRAATWRQYQKDHPAK